MHAALQIVMPGFKNYNNTQKFIGVTLISRFKLKSTLLVWKLRRLGYSKALI